MRPIRFIAAALLVAALAPGVFALEVPPPPAQWYTDRANLLNDVAAQGLNEKLRNFEQQSGAQFIIYVFPALEGESIEDFTIRCVERWKVGQAKYDNGLVLFVFVEEKKVRVEVGYGLEGTVTDAFSSRVIREQIAPHFQRADYGGGLNAAADAIITKIKTGEEPVPPLASPSGGGQESDINPIFIIFILIFVFFFVVPMLTRRRRGCGGCALPLFFPMGGGGITFGGGGGGFGGGFGGGGGFSGGGGGFGGGGATGGW